MKLRSLRLLVGLISFIWISPAHSFPQDSHSAKETPATEPKNLSVVDDSLADLLQEIPELEGIEGAQDQRELSGILKKVGEREEVFLREVPDISAEEQVTREDVGRAKQPSEPKAKKPTDKPIVKPANVASYSYLMIPHLTIDGISFDEFRVPESKSFGDSEIARGFTVTKGFALMPLHFHPSFQFESSFRYLGRQTVDQRSMYVIAFAQKSDVARFTARITHLGNSADIPFQGIAWIEPQNFHIVRMRTDLLSPYPQVELQELTTQIEFAEVQLQRVPQALWLPTRVAVTTVSNGKAYRNLHTYGSFRRFGSETKILPAQTADTPASPK